MTYRTALILTLPLAGLLAMASCDSKKPPAPEVKTRQADGKTNETAARTPEGEWCAEHGVPEAICTRCHANLIAAFKEKGDWCKEHNLPESQCIKCNPELKAKFEAMKPAGN